MKKCGLILCALVLICALPGVGFTAPVMVYDGGYGTGTWSDVNKISSADSLLCWAAVASNSLYFAGYPGWNSASSTYINTAGDIYLAYVNGVNGHAGWPNNIGSPIYAYEWWMTNRTQSNIVQTPPKTFPSQGLNFYPTAPVLETGSVTAFWTGGDTYGGLDGYISDHRAIGAVFDVAASDVGPYGHVVTVWGWDKATNQIFITDSDDGATPQLETFNFTTDSSNNIVILGYTNTYTDPIDVTVTELDRLNINSGYELNNGTGPGPVVPLPPTVLLFGSSLLGLVGWRRFRKS
jgi:hypothetical protein